MSGWDEIVKGEVKGGFYRKLGGDRGNEVVFGCGGMYILRFGFGF